MSCHGTGVRFPPPPPVLIWQDVTPWHGLGAGLAAVTTINARAVPRSARFGRTVDLPSSMCAEATVTPFPRQRDVSVSLANEKGGRWAWMGPSRTCVGMGLIVADVAGSGSWTTSPRRWGLLLAGPRARARHRGRRIVSPYSAMISMPHRRGGLPETLLSESSAVSDGLAARR